VSYAGFFNGGGSLKINNYSTVTRLSLNNNEEAFLVILTHIKYKILNVYVYDKKN
jgi:hypothetical protein